MSSDGNRGQSTTAVRQALNVAKLANWIVKTSPLPRILEFHPVAALLSDASSLAERLEVRQFGFGQSNPTYLLKIGDFSAVLRKKPNKVAHASAHALHREYRVLQALQQQNRLHPSQTVPVPRLYAYCKDPDVLGAEFYLMEFVKGRIFTDASIPGLAPVERKEAFANAVSTLANIHCVDIVEVGLESFGKQGNYVQRQLGRLMSVSQKQSQLGAPAPEIEDLAK